MLLLSCCGISVHTNVSGDSHRQRQIEKCYAKTAQQRQERAVLTRAGQYEPKLMSQYVQAGW